MSNSSWQFLKMENGQEKNVQSINCMAWNYKFFCAHVIKSWQEEKEKLGHMLQIDVCCSP